MNKVMRQNNRSVGTAYERAAGAFLEEKGYRILEYNYRCRAGEIDLIAEDEEYLVFCEVKYRKTDAKGNPLEAVDLRKQQRIYRCALHYMTVHGKIDYPARFDVIGIKGKEFLHIKNAFQGV